MTVDKSSVLLGSGQLYVLAFAGTIPADATVEAAANDMGRISGGATLEYKPTEYTVEDDSGAQVKRFVTKEEVTFKSGVLTWDVANLAKLSPGTYADDTATKKKKLTLGGAKALPNMLVRFVHTKDDGTKLRITLVATAGNGFTLTFDKEKETVVDAEFSAISQTDGTLVVIEDTYL